jgi:hypothetical protein
MVRVSVHSVKQGLSGVGESGAELAKGKRQPDMNVLLFERYRAQAAREAGPAAGSRPDVRVWTLMNGNMAVDDRRPPSFDQIARTRSRQGHWSGDI